MSLNFLVTSSLSSSQEGFLSSVGSLKGVKHAIYLSQVSIPLSFSLASRCQNKLLQFVNLSLIRLQLSVYRGSGGIQALMNNNARKLAEQDEATLVGFGIPYTIIRVGMLQNTPGGTQGFNFEKVPLISFFLLFS